MLQKRVHQQLRMQEEKKINKGIVEGCRQVIDDGFPFIAERMNCCDRTL